MAEYMTTKEASEKWDITERRINVLCKEGRIPGAYKEDKRWVIPMNAVKPADKRLRGEPGISVSKKEAAVNGSKKLSLPIGISDYRKGWRMMKKQNVTSCNNLMNCAFSIDVCREKIYKFQLKILIGNHTYKYLYYICK